MADCDTNKPNPEPLPLTSKPRCLEVDKHEPDEVEEDSTVDTGNLQLLDDVATNCMGKPDDNALKGLSNRALKRLRQKERHQQEGNTTQLPAKLIQSMEKDGTSSRNTDGNLSNRAMRRQRRLERVKVKSKKGRKVEDRGYSANIFSETEYYFEDGLRKVYPYNFTFNTHAKERWFKKTLIEVFSKEFLAETPEVYRRHIELGKILVNGEETTADYVLKNGDEISHTIHRHENPVVGCDIEIISDTEDVLVINKPASIPCHPCGKYRHNSIVFILGKEYGYCNLRNIYRLDRLTSGVLILGKTVIRTKQLEDHICKRQVQKEYVSRVVGKFPDGVIKVDQPLSCMRHNLTLWRVQKGGKESQTTFERLSYNGHSSIVKCVPHTGRTHQIRVHLQYVGHPIVNDPFYNTAAWGPSRGKGGLVEKEEKEVMTAILKEHNVGQWVEGENPFYRKKLNEINVQAVKKIDQEPNEVQDKIMKSSVQEDSKVLEEEAKRTEIEANKTSTNDLDDCKNIDSTDDTPPSKKMKLTNDRSPAFDENMLTIDEECEECKKKYSNPSPKDLVLYLHAFKYKGPDWEYEAPLPDWAAEDWQKE